MGNGWVRNEPTKDLMEEEEGYKALRLLLQIQACLRPAFQLVIRVFTWKYDNPNYQNLRCALAWLVIMPKRGQKETQSRCDVKATKKGQQQPSVQKMRMPR